MHMQGDSNDKMMALRGNKEGWDKTVWEFLEGILIFGKNFSLSSEKNFLGTPDTETNCT